MHSDIQTRVSGDWEMEEGMKRFWLAALCFCAIWGALMLCIWLGGIDVPVKYQFPFWPVYYRYEVIERMSIYFIFCGWVVGLLFWLGLPVGIAAFSWLIAKPKADRI